MYIQPHSEARNQEREEASPALFENRKKCPDFWKKSPDFVHLWVKFFIQNVALRVSRRKNSKMLSCRASFSGVFEEIFIEVPKFHKPLPLAQKNFWLLTCTQALFILQNAPC